MLSCSLLLNLPQDWQLKMHNEITSKLHLCISNIEMARNVATQTWRYLSQDSFDKNELSQKLKPYLFDHASDFTEWVSDFAQKSIEYYLETHSNGGNSGLNHNGPNVTSSGVVSEESIEPNSRLFKSALKDLSSQNSFSSEGRQSFNSLDSTSHESARTPSHFDVTVNPLDETLDNLILKEKIAKLQGQANAGLGVQSKSEKFKDAFDPEFDGRRRFKPKPVFYKNLTLVNVDHENGVHENPGLTTPQSTSSNNSYTTPGGVAKVPKMCINFPNCQFGENCRYIHPNKICKNWPDCFYGDKCAFIHPDK
ncbi:uncharacterized protein TOT_040000974 [Theileria orientalis strain Shintoku]|uniref:C3H1-type domain-containing protein n=1 Tax=Theileria orientalis strain Shintoku TaxID=869250 RepID=J7M8H8_THEOR|nr:uncharacterized protein TOT_040000974 [Theileria orientalis strain Shintoku]BAM42313.1 uncharacterized protein TOT_040000974 [Theileria orientalis strain Shintoku]|eukprot:XP_009692614.1 uncharacterized protein TOT_040000974 [Theileria orientalis strain Shintoku]